MSYTSGDRENLIISTRVKDEGMSYRFRWVKKLVEKLFPPKLPNFRAATSRQAKTA